MQMQASTLYYVCSALIIDNLGLVQAHAYAYACTYVRGGHGRRHTYIQNIYIEDA